MRNIVLFGAGKSSFSLISYLLENAVNENWHLFIADMNPKAVSALFQHEHLSIIEFDLSNTDLKDRLIQKADVVLSMLPARFHIEIALSCLQFSKSLITPSYTTDEMKALDEDVKRKGITFINEMGLDPGIDHMSAIKLIHRIKAEGGTIVGFESFCGGLIAPESDTNPWHYKFTWNARNVVLAGQGGAVKFLHNGKFKYIPYHKLFDRTEIIEIKDYGKFEGYANRDSLKYVDLYDLKGIKTMYRGTFRRPPFCKAWHVLVQLGATDDSYVVEDSENMTYREFMNTFLKFREKDSVEIKLAYYLNIDVDGEELKLLEWLGLFEDKKIGIAKATPAQILQNLLEEKWALEEDDKDMIVMWHLLTYTINGKTYRLESSMVTIGEDKYQTAMAKTVGYPMGIMTKLLLNDKIKSKGVILPLNEEIYKPILEELERFNIQFNEVDKQID